MQIIRHFHFCSEWLLIKSGCRVSAFLILHQEIVTNNCWLNRMHSAADMCLSVIMSYHLELSAHPAGCCQHTHTQHTDKHTHTAGRITVRAVRTSWLTGQSAYMHQQFPLTWGQMRGKERKILWRLMKEISVVYWCETSYVKGNRGERTSLLFVQILRNQRLLRLKSAHIFYLYFFPPSVYLWEVPKFILRFLIQLSEE